MSFEASAFCLTTAEIQTLKTIAFYEPLSGEIIQDIHAVQSLIDKGFVEKVHQEIAEIDRYRLTINGRIKHHSLSIIQL